MSWSLRACRRQSQNPDLHGILRTSNPKTFGILQGPAHNNLVCLLFGWNLRYHYAMFKPPYLGTVLLVHLSSSHFAEARIHNIFSEDVGKTAATAATFFCHSACRAHKKVNRGNSARQQSAASTLMVTWLPTLWPLAPCIIMIKRQLKHASEQCW